METDRLREGVDGVLRCWWCGNDAQYIDYHDNEWGRPVVDDTGLFEKICLEGFQSGLSWLTILRKRDNFRRAFASFDIDVVATFGVADISRLLDDAGIVRHRGKIEATINNAARAIEMRTEFGSLRRYLWGHAPDSPFGWDVPRADEAAVIATSSTATALSKDLKKRGWRFVGPTTIYSFMQSMGFVNDHFEGCAVREACEAERASVVSAR
jgi:DNA-3-methyladenine glycosylase I